MVDVKFPIVKLIQLIIIVKAYYASTNVGCLLRPELASLNIIKPAMLLADSSS